MITALDCALLCQHAYSDTPTIGQESSAARWVKYDTAEGIALIAPGTNNERCILADIDAIPFDTGKFGKVHKGIWEAFFPLFESAAEIGPDIVSGHSEGAAGAIYLTAYLCSIGKP